MRQCRTSPQYHTTRYPDHHAISATQGCANGLQSNEESEEEGDGGVKVGRGQADIASEVGGFCVADLEGGEYGMK